MGASQKLQPFEAYSINGRVTVLDVAYLNRATFGDIPLRNEIIDLFLSQVNSLAGRLELPFEASSWHFLTHTLKGSAAAVGARHMVDIATNWELRHVPKTAEARNALAAELRGAILAFEKAASNLH